MKILLHGRDSASWVSRLEETAPGTRVETASSEAEAVSKIADADAYFGTITPAMLAAAKNLRWIQTPMAGLERYFLPALIERPVIVTDMRGIFHDMIPDHIMCYILCFARAASPPTATTGALMSWQKTSAASTPVRR